MSMSNKPTDNNSLYRFDIPFPNLLNEMMWDARKERAKLVMKKCIDMGHYKWAMQIALHYGIQDERTHCDTVVAIAFALHHSKTFDNNK